MEYKVKNALQNSSGGKLKNCIQKEYYTILTINLLVGKIVKFPTTTVLKGILNFFFHVYPQSPKSHCRCGREKREILCRENRLQHIPRFHASLAFFALTVCLSSSLVYLWEAPERTSDINAGFNEYEWSGTGILIKEIEGVLSGFPRPGVAIIKNRYAN